MTWLVFAVSGLLVLAGAAAVISGTPIIQIERGWAEVISGTVALAGGGITFALGVVLVRLEALQKSFGSAGSRDHNTAGDMVVPAYDPPPSDFRSSLHPPDPAEGGAAMSSTEPTEGTSETRHGLWKRVRRPAPYPAGLDENPLPPPETMTFEPPSSHPAFEAPADVDDHVPALTERSLPALQDGHRDAQPVAVSPPPVEEKVDLDAESEEAAMPLRGAALTEKWLSQPILKLRPQRAPMRTDDPVEQPEPVLAHGDDGETLADARAPAVGVPEFGLTSDAAEAADRPEPPPTVVGRYQAGVASYVMYSDGTIHVETDGGEVHRFESMDELKAFIARQDISAS